MQFATFQTINRQVKNLLARDRAHNSQEGKHKCTDLNKVYVKTMESAIFDARITHGINISMN